jgi:hypothetical protein
VNIEVKEFGSLSDIMEDGSYTSHCKRIDEVKKSVPPSNKIVGAIVILPDTREIPGDPKHALRAGFADRNRLTQFITPDSLIKWEDKNCSPEHQINGAVMDMLRQFGYTEFYEKRNMKNNPAFKADAIGMYVLHQLKPLCTEKLRMAKDTVHFLPVYVTYNVKNGKVFVDCDLFDMRHISYPEALITFSKLSRDKEFIGKCIGTEKSGFSTKLLGLNRLYRDDPALILSQANRFTRELWQGLTDKKNIGLSNQSSIYS